MESQQNAPTSEIEIKEFNEEPLESPSLTQPFIQSEEGPNKHRQIGFFGTLMNLMNALLGAGILTVPSALASNGTVLSSFTILFICFLSFISTLQIVKLQLETDTEGYDSLTHKVMGQVGSIIYSIFNIIYLLLILLVYVVLGTDMVISWLSNIKTFTKSILNRALVTLIYVAVLPLPLTLLSKLKILSYFSTATVFFILIFVIGMIVKSSLYFKNHKISPTCVKGKFDLTIFYSISIYVSAFSLSSLAPPILHDFDVDFSRRRLVIGITLGICFILIIIPAIFSYLMFGDSTERDVLNSFPNNEIFIIIVRACFFLIISFSFPIVSQSVMCSFSQMFFKNNYANSLPIKKRIFVAILANIFPLGFGMFLPQAKPAMGIGAAIGGSFINYVFPPVMWLIYYWPKFDIKAFLCIIFIILGVATSGLSAYESILDFISSFKNRSQ